MTRLEPLQRRSLAMAVALAAALAEGAPARAAGGHHAVDDAALLEPGQCQLETWWDRESGGARSLLHVGPGCRVGAVELGLNIDPVRERDTGTTTVTGVQIKWARAVSDSWSAGAVLGLATQDHTPRHVSGTLVIPITWQATETLLAHLNVGRDFRRGEPDTSRTGIALEWSALADGTFIAERFRDSGANFWRAGARWAFNPATNVDLSRARSMGSSTRAWWTLGINWVFER